MQGTPRSPMTPKMLNSVTLNHPPASNTHWQTCQASSRSRAQPDTVRTGTCQQQRYHAGTVAVGTSAFYSQCTALSLTCLLLQVQPPKPCSPASKGVSQFSLNSSAVELHNETETLSEGSPSYTVQHIVKSPSLYCFKEKRETPALSGKAIWHRQRKCKYPQLNFHQIDPTIIYTNSADE